MADDTSFDLSSAQPTFADQGDASTTDSAAAPAAASTPASGDTSGFDLNSAATTDFAAGQAAAFPYGATDPQKQLDQMFPPKPGEGRFSQADQEFNESFKDFWKRKYYGVASLVGANEDKNIGQLNAKDKLLQSTMPGFLGGIAAGAIPGAILPGSVLLQGAVQGGLSGMDPGSLHSRLVNAGLGTAFGAGGAAIGNMGMGFVPKNTLGDAANVGVDYLKSRNITLPTSTQTGSRMLSAFRSPEITEQANKDFTREALKEFGVTGDTADQTTMAGIKSKIKSDYDTVYQRNPVQLKIHSYVPGQGPTVSMTPFDNQLSQLTRATNVMSSGDKQAARGLINRLRAGTDPNSGIIAPAYWRAVRADVSALSSRGGNIADFGGNLGKAMDGAFENGLSVPADKALWQNVKDRTRNLGFLEKSIGPDDKVNPQALFRSMDVNRNKGMTTYGQGPQGLWDLAQAAKSTGLGLAGTAEGKGWTQAGKTGALIEGLRDLVTEGNPGTLVKLGAITAAAPKIGSAMENSAFGRSVLPAIANSPVTKLAHRVVPAVGASTGATIGTNPNKPWQKKKDNQ